MDLELQRVNANKRKMKNMFGTTIKTDELVELLLLNQLPKTLEYLAQKAVFENQETMKFDQLMSTLK